MTNLSDKEIIIKAFFSYMDFCNSKIEIMHKDAIKDCRDDFLRTIEKYILFLKQSPTIVERQACCKKVKKLYKKICEYIKNNPEIRTEYFEKKLYQLLSFVADNEIEKLQFYKRDNPLVEKIDLSILFEDKENITNLINKTIDCIISESLRNKKYTVVGEEEGIVYISSKGMKYHQKNCPYCRGIELRLTTIEEAINIRLEPCQCILDENIITEDIKESLEYATAFVDESIRQNIWKQFDSNQSDTCGSFSYIICDGYLTNEEQITDNNIIYSDISLSENHIDTTGLSIEAITTVLLKLLSRGYTGHVLIYTDNIGAKNSWYQNNINKNLLSLFKSVKVCHIPREKNKKADKLGRTQILIKTTPKCIQSISNALMI